MAGATVLTRKPARPAKSDSTQFRKLALPQIRSVVLTGFSVYQQHRSVSVSFGQGATCLAGANGIGKSTFLSAVMFGLTGAVPVVDDGKESEDISEYRKRAEAFTSQYFNGRINDRDRSRASVRLTLTLANQLITIERPVFKPGLSAFSVAKNNTNRTAILPAVNSMTAENRRKAFETWLSTQVGLESFNQFIFLNHFVLMFDESRHLLFWDSRASEQAMFLIFGGNKEASSADTLRRDIERNDSLARNAQYQITNTEKRMEEIRLALGVSSTALTTDVALVERIAILVESEESMIDELGKVEDRLRDNALVLADRAASVVVLRDEYARKFQSIVSSHADPADHPAVKGSLDEGRCTICGTTSPGVQAHIRSALAKNHCPLCSASLSNIEQSGSYQELKAVDQRISAAQEQLKLSNTENARLNDDRQGILARLEEVRLQLKRFEKTNRDAVARARNRGLVEGADQGRVTLAALALDVDQQKSKKAKLILDRDRQKVQLRSLQAQLARRYALAEAHFVPAFRALAEQFLGIPVTVRLQGSVTCSPELCRG